MVETLFSFWPYVFLVLAICWFGHVVKPYATFSSKGGIPDKPDLRIAHLSKEMQTFFDLKAKEKKRMEIYRERDQMQKEYYLALHEAELTKRVEAWKRGEPNKEVPKMRGTERTRLLSEMPQYYYSPRMGRPYRYQSYMGNL